MMNFQSGNQQRRKRKSLFIVSFLLTVIFIISCLSCDSQSNEEKIIYIVFRFDDYSAISSTDLELKIFDVFRTSGASLTVGVIPFVYPGQWNDLTPRELVPLTESKGTILMRGYEEGILEIAMHGYSHQTVDPKRTSEFSGLEYISQLGRLTKGKNYLETMIGIPIDTFIPPWNEYDLNTLRALEEVGFITLSADRRGKATEESRLKYLPVTANISQLQAAVRTARTAKVSQTIIVALFHAYDLDNVRDSITLQELSDQLNWLISQEDVRLITISEATRVIHDLGADRYLSNRTNYLRSRLLPPSLRNQAYMLLYQGPQPIREYFLLANVIGFYLMLIILGTVFSLIICILLLRRLSLIRAMALYGSIGLSLIMLIYLFYDQQFYFKGVALVISAIVIGACLGFLACSLRLKPK